MISLLLLLAAIVCAVWAALVDAGHIDVGAYGQLLAIALALFAASFLPWVRER